MQQQQQLRRPLQMHLHHTRSICVRIEFSVVVSLVIFCSLEITISIPCRVRRPSCITPISFFIFFIVAKKSHKLTAHRVICLVADAKNNICTLTQHKHTQAASCDGNSAACVVRRYPLPARRLISLCRIMNKSHLFRFFSLLMPVTLSRRRLAGSTSK